MKKTLALFLSIFLLLSLFPMGVLAEGESALVKFRFYNGDDFLGEQELDATALTLTFPAVDASRLGAEEKTEYFAGWYDENSVLFDSSRKALNKLADNAVGETVITLHAVYRENFCVYLMLESDDECSLMKTETVEAGATVSLPATLMVEGQERTVEGWYTNRDTAVCDFSAEIPVSSDLLVYAKLAELQGNPQPALMLSAPLTQSGTHTVTVSVVGAGSSNPTEKTVADGGQITIFFTPSTGFALESVKCSAGGSEENLPFSDNSCILQNISEDKAITAEFTTDSNQDGIPDSHQILVTFAVSGGTFGGSDSELKRYYTVQTLDDQGLWQDVANAPLLGNEIPTNMVSDASHSGTGAWTESFDASTPVTAEHTYTYVFTPVLSYYAPAQDGPEEKELENPGTFTVDPAGGLFEGSEVPCEKKITEDTLLENPTKEGCVFWGWEYDEGTNTFTATWEKDEVGMLTAQFTQESDGIPDRYQKEVIYRVVNGIWADKITIDRVNYLTLRDSEGHLSETGSASAADIIPQNMTPAYGYVATGAAWDVEPKTVETGTTPVIYTYTFVTHSENPSTGDHSNSALWITLMCLSGAGICVCAWMLGKQKKRRA